MNPNLKDQADQVGEAYAREIRLKSKNWLFRSSTFLFHGFFKLNTVQNYKRAQISKIYLNMLTKYLMTKQAKNSLKFNKIQAISIF